MSRVERKLSGWRLVVAVLIALAFVGGVLYFDRENLASLELVEPWFLLAAGFGVLLSAGALAGLLRQTLAPIGVDLAWREAFLVSAGSRFLDTFAPMRAGLLARGAYLVRSCDLPVALWISNTAAMQLLHLGGAAVVFLAAMGARAHQGRGLPIPLVLFTAGCLVALVVVLAWSPEGRGLRAEGITGRIRVALEGWNRLRSDRSAVLGSLFWSSGGQVVYGVLQWMIFQTIGAPIELADAIAMTTVANLTGVLYVTPGGFGVREALLTFTGVAIGVAPAHAVAGSLLLHAVHVVALGVLAPASLPLLLGPKADP